jgi:NAD(P)-dependent dehydrogenase (short-subunit alcohol dehydrogenase family)
MAERSTRKLSNRIALVTGGVRRVGLSIARELAACGADLIVTYHASPPEVVRAAVADLERAGGGKVVAQKVDLGSIHQLTRFLARLEKKHPRIDYLINSAANFDRKTLDETTPADFEATMNLNLRAPFFLAKQLAHSMRQQGFGRIVNIADVAGYIPWPSYLAYSISKAGVIALTKGLAKALAPEVLVNAVAPGPVLLPDDYDSDSVRNAIDPTVLKRRGSPEDVAAAVLFLLESDYITGVTLPVDGGRLLR